jgi:hypothetical protein
LRRRRGGLLCLRRLRVRLRAWFALTGDEREEREGEARPTSGSQA